MNNIPAAEAFLAMWNSCHPSLKFTMDLANGNEIPFIGLTIVKNGRTLSTRVYVKLTNTGLFLYIFTVMWTYATKNRFSKPCSIDRAYRFLSTHEFFQEECECLKQVFIKLKYPLRLIDSVLATHLNQVRKEKVENPSRSWRCCAYCTSF